MTQFEQWTGFHGKLWKEEVNIRDFIQNNYTSMRATNLSWRLLQKQQINSGVSCRNCRKKKEPRAAFWIWRQKWYPV